MTEEGKSDLAIYLRDHYAGAVGAIELLEHLSKAYEGKDMGLFFQHLLSEVREDHATLHEIMAGLDIKESVVRDAGAWVAEKFARGKLGFGDGATSGIRTLQALETLFLGISGKRLLWRALANVPDALMVSHDFAALEKRAAEQLERVEAERLAAAGSTFHRLP